MTLPNKTDTNFLNKIRHEGKYHPFSIKYNNQSNDKLYADASSSGASPDTLSIIKLGDYFNTEFHKKLTAALVSLLKQINLPAEEIRQLIIAHLNEQELVIKKKYEPLLDTKEFNKAFDRQFDALIRKNMPDNPQSFVMLSEGAIEFGNLILRYLAVVKHENSSLQTLDEENAIKLSEKLLRLTNIYYLIKDHYDNCLFNNGRIELTDSGDLVFDLGENDITLLENISVLIIENQRMKSLDKTSWLFEQLP
ncbi:MAG: hypothetical protein ABI295_06000, partial [Xanthomarina sp.]